IAPPHAGQPLRRHGTLLTMSPRAVPPRVTSAYGSGAPSTMSAPFPLLSVSAPAPPTRTSPAMTVPINVSAPPPPRTVTGPARKPAALTPAGKLNQLSARVSRHNSLGGGPPAWRPATRGAATAIWSGSRLCPPVRGTLLRPPIATF